MQGNTSLLRSHVPGIDVPECTKAKAYIARIPTSARCCEPREFLIGNNPGIVSGNKVAGFAEFLEFILGQRSRSYFIDAALQQRRSGSGSE